MTNPELCPRCCQGVMEILVTAIVAGVEKQQRACPHCGHQCIRDRPREAWEPNDDGDDDEVRD